jgi:hypothetical protein
MPAGAVPMVVGEVRIGVGAGVAVGQGPYGGWRNCGGAGVIRRGLVRSPSYLGRGFLSAIGHCPWKACLSRSLSNCIFVGRRQRIGS